MSRGKNLTTKGTTYHEGRTKKAIRRSSSPTHYAVLREFSREELKKFKDSGIVFTAEPATHRVP